MSPEGSWGSTEADGAGLSCAADNPSQDSVKALSRATVATQEVAQAWAQPFLSILCEAP